MPAKINFVCSETASMCWECADIIELTLPEEVILKLDFLPATMDEICSNDMRSQRLWAALQYCQDMCIPLMDPRRAIPTGKRKRDGESLMTNRVDPGVKGNFIHAAMLRAVCLWNNCISSNRKGHVCARCRLPTTRECHTCDIMGNVQQSYQCDDCNYVFGYCACRMQAAAPGGANQGQLQLAKGNRSNDLGDGKAGVKTEVKKEHKQEVPTDEDVEQELATIIKILQSARTIGSGTPPPSPEWPADDTQPQLESQAVMKALAMISGSDTSLSLPQPADDAPPALEPLAEEDEPEAGPDAPDLTTEMLDKIYDHFMQTLGKMDKGAEMFTPMKVERVHEWGQPDSSPS